MKHKRRLIILEEPGKHREVISEAEMLEIGRAPSLAVVLSDRTVSRRHAVIRKKEGELVLEDVGSTFGTSVNGQPLSPRTAVILRDGDVIEVGKVQIVCRFDRDEQDVRSATRDALFAAQANARLVVLEGEQVRRWPLASAAVLVGRAPHCEVRLQDVAEPPERALIRAAQGQFFVEPRAAGAPPRLNERQAPVQGVTPLQSNAVLLFQRVQALFLYDYGEHGAPVADPLRQISRGRLLRHIARQTGLAYGHLKHLCRRYDVLGQNVGELLVQEKVLTPLFWRVFCARLLASCTRRSRLGRFLRKEQRP